MHGFAPGSFPANYPGPDIAHTYLYQLHAHQFVVAALEAEAQGFDGMVLASLPSPLIQEIRSLVDIPVVGYGDSAFRLAGMYGRRFGLLLFNVERLEFWPQRIQELGVERGFAGVRPSGVTFGEVAAAHGDPAMLRDVLARVVASAERMVEELGVDVLVPGEMPLNILLAEAGIDRIAGATVMDGLACAFKTAEMMVELQRISGMGAEPPRLLPRGPRQGAGARGAGLLWHRRARTETVHISLKDLIPHLARAAEPARPADIATIAERAVEQHHANQGIRAAPATRRITGILANQEAHAENAPRSPGHGSDPIGSVYEYYDSELTRRETARPPEPVKTVLGLPTNRLTGVKFGNVPIGAPVNMLDHCDATVGGDPTLANAASGKLFADFIIDTASRLMEHMKAATVHKPVVSGSATQIDLTTPYSARPAVTRHSHSL